MLSKPKQHRPQDSKFPFYTSLFSVQPNGEWQGHAQWKPIGTYNILKPNSEFQMNKKHHKLKHTCAQNKTKLFDESSVQ